MNQPLQRTAAQLAESMAELTRELNELKRRKKAWNAEINSRIKDLEEQIEGENEQWQHLKTNQ